MPATNTEIVHLTFDALNTGELDPALAHVHPDIEFRTVDWVDAEACVEVDVRFCMLYTFEGGQITRIDNFRETAEALKAAGQAG